MTVQQETNVVETAIDAMDIWFAFLNRVKDGFESDSMSIEQFTECAQGQENVLRETVDKVIVRDSIIVYVIDEDFRQHWGQFPEIDFIRLSKRPDWALARRVICCLSFMGKNPHAMAASAMLNWWVGDNDEANRLANEALEIDGSLRLAVLMMNILMFDIVPPWK
ncbi:hypothetical protein JTE88_08285 [Arcanobacterium phocisimile]|uniref:Uncharacterized protein n=1 Tax=Arcanobacterium phocisimile TaxID=1302235 RepID=A0ABX7IGG2_9ACTO|nr:hypothetical protein [Arcanobacterium phocisimile]QRV02057.1 hypothetical protein JTE88_08285 [Arcanobacterium phocisimile]